MINDYGIEASLRSWLVLDNHDTPRLRRMLPDKSTRRLAQVLQFTLPGAPVIYYGTEIGMDGGGDPENRGPMRWSWLEPTDTNGAHEKTAENSEKPSENPSEPAAPGETPSTPARTNHASRAADELAWMRTLVELREAHPALRVGDHRQLHTESLLAFQRWTDRREETVIVVVNPTDRIVREPVQMRDSKQMGYSPFRCALTGREFAPHSGLLHLEVPPRTAFVLAATSPAPNRYTPFKRMQ